MELDAIGKAIKTSHLVPLVSHSNLGLEVTMQRVASDGQLSTQAVPAAWTRSANRQLRAGFAQSQVKLTTPAMRDVSALMAYLTGLNATARRALPAGDLLWPLSSNPVLPAKLSEIALTASDADDLKYRRAQARKYNVRQLMTSGVHVNLSFNEQLLLRLFTETFHRQYASYVAFRNALYVKVAQGLVRMNWLIQYLFGATPALNFTDRRSKRQRSSVHGTSGRYGQVSADYSTLASYVTSLEQAVTAGQLMATDDFAGPVRFRGNGALADLATNGVYYLEFQGLDLDPNSAVGVDQKAVEFIRLLASYFAMMPALPAKMVPQVNQQARQLLEQVTSENPTTASAQAVPAEQVLGALRHFVTANGLPERNATLIDTLKKRVADPKRTLSATVAMAPDPLAWANQQAAGFQADATATPFQLPGFSALDLSSQLVVERALARGIRVNVVDTRANILRLTAGQTTRLLVAGSGTDLNPQALTSALPHKAAAKQLLAEHGVQVPASQTYHTANQLIDDYDRFAQEGGIVLKAADEPDIVAVFRIMPKRELFERVVHQLFEQTRAVMAEEVIVGASYRFLVIDGKVRAVAERIPANVVGDGRTPIQTLLDRKNGRPLRGDAGSHPQTTIKLGTIERYRLAAYQMDLETVVGRGSQVLLREDATFTNGADLLDVTTEVHPSYVQAVEKLAGTLGLRVAGFDVVMPNLYAELTADHPEMAVFLGVHATPALYPHAFPSFGDAQPVADDLLTALFADPEDSDN
ncbi:bifunctional glutamate--cysteine ligase GshA/glutathione synthetase GshB [Lactiplantibacillus plajomi]|uniref:glutamate--cysteine ligase n=1 Tax=Lactiplantibacillus plajomi TaxID=1457217 RepID=A0ABV6K6L0_9LACO|nr:bifunctional glutamate--cysteine ligase GshA/glutathione synthetase GshB [Lactiplantibacillus plajomi]